MKVPVGHPEPPPGTLFYTLVGQAMERMKRDATIQDTSDSDSDSEEGNPFLEENHILDQLRRITQLIHVNPSTMQPDPPI